MWAYEWMGALFLDLRYAARMLLRNPILTIMAVLTVGIGVGINTAIFTLFNLRFQPLPIKDPDAAVRLEIGRDSFLKSFTTYTYLRDHAETISGLTASHYEEVVVGDPNTLEEPTHITAKFVSDNFFAVLDVPAMMGRTFSPEEISAPGKEPLVVLSYYFWNKHFGGDPDILGHTLRVNGKSFLIIGVTSREFVGFGLEEGPVPPDVWLPLMMKGALEPQEASAKDYFGSDSGKWLQLSLCGRLKPGRTSEEALSETKLLLMQLTADRPMPDRRDPIKVIPLSLTGDADISPDTWTAMAFIMAVTLTVLLVACANIASLLLARAMARQKEIALRLSLGATPGRLIRQLLTESLLLAILSGGFGLLLAWGSLKLFLGTSLLSAISGGQDLTLILSYLTPDMRVLAYTFLITLVSGVAFGLAPALLAGRVDLTTVLKEDAHSFGKNTSRSRLSNALVIAQLALSLVLLITAGLVLRGLNRIREDNLGFNVKNVAIVDFNLRSRNYNAQREDQFRQELVARFAAVPGVQSVSQSMRLPFDLMKETTLTSESADGASESKTSLSSFNKVTENYFNGLDIQLTRGRGFTADEVRGRAQVVVITEATARNLWPDQDPVGKNLRLDDPDIPFAQVVGVARDTRNIRSGEIYPLFVYAPLPPPLDSAASKNKPSLTYRIAIRTAGEAKEIKSALLAASQSYDPTLLLKVNTMREGIASIDQVSWARPAPALMASLGLFALLLAAIGLYGVISYSVSQRTREIGIRMALGASRLQVLRLVIGQGLRLTGIGIALGLGGGVAVSRALSSMLFGLSPFDPVAYLGVSVFLVVIALLAVFLPANRAASVDPMAALRHQ